MTKNIFIGAVLAYFSIVGCDKDSHRSNLSGHQEVAKNVLIEDLVISPEKSIGRTVCLVAIARASRHGLMLFDDPGSKYGVPADIYDSEVNSDLEREFMDWVKDHRRSGQLVMVFNGILASSDRYPSYPYEMKIVDVFFIQELSKQNADATPKISSYCKAVGDEENQSQSGVN